MGNNSRSKSLALMGMKKGGKTGFYLSLIYDLLFPFIWLYTDPSLHRGPTLEELFGWGVILPFYGIVIGCLPATILGGFTGWLVGKMFSWMGHRLTPLRSMLMGFSVTVIIALLFNGFIIFDTRQPSPWLWNWSYLVVLGIPTVIYVLASPVGSYCLYRERVR